MPTTANRAIRYPAGTDKVADGAQAMQDLADDTDAALGPDSGWVQITAGAQPGWEVAASDAEAYYRNVNGWVYLYVKANRSGGDITPNSVGNIASEMLDLTAQGVPTPTYPVVGASHVGKYATVTAELLAGGMLTAEAMEPAGTINTGDNLVVTMSYPVL